MILGTKLRSPFKICWNNYRQNPWIFFKKFLSRNIIYVRYGQCAKFIHFFVLFLFFVCFHFNTFFNYQISLLLVIWMLSFLFTNLQKKKIFAKKPVFFFNSNVLNWSIERFDSNRIKSNVFDVRVKKWSNVSHYQRSSTVISISNQIEIWKNFVVF